MQLPFNCKILSFSRKTFMYMLLNVNFMSTVYKTFQESVNDAKPFELGNHLKNIEAKCILGVFCIIF